MYTQNFLWNVHVVSLGLMNGARGTVVAILYKPTGQQRVNDVEAPVGFPDGPRKCPLPNLVVVNFPDYKGDPFFKDLPSTWVPVPVIKTHGKQR